MQNSDDYQEEMMRRPLGMTLLSGLYLFLFLVTAAGFGSPVPLMGVIYQGRPAEIAVFADTLICLYMFLGLMRRQRLTWFLMLGYNVLQVVNTLINMVFITTGELESVLDKKVDSGDLIIANIAVITAILLLSLFIFSNKNYFSNRSAYLL